MSISLSREEFASALGMKSNDMFVRKMFKVVDKERNGRISFRNFLDTVVLFSRGNCEDKLRQIFRFRTLFRGLFVKKLVGRHFLPSVFYEVPVRKSIISEFLQLFFQNF
jgi:hypothetical protein